MVALLLVGLAFGWSSVAAAPLDPSVWSLVWSDEFNRPNGTAVDTAKWTMETGGGGWGNNELQTYTNRIQNSYHENDKLVIKAIKETFTGTDNITRAYTSARLITKDKVTQTYGRFEARLRVPFGQGIWPAFWMLGNNIGSAGWPNCGEIDIMENIGREPSTVHGTLHGPGYSGGSGIGAGYTLPDGQKFSDAFHTFAVEWEPNVVRWYVDGYLYSTKRASDLPPGRTWVFDHPFFIILNVAVGGFWPGNPDATTVFPQTMQVDYVRLYQRANPSNIPVVLTEEDSLAGIAIDSVTWRRDPFPVIQTFNFSSDRRTRINLFVANVDLVVGDNASVITAQAEDSQGRFFPLTVEHVGALPLLDWVTQVIVKLPDELIDAGNVLISVNARGHVSNKMAVAVAN